MTYVMTLHMFPLFVSTNIISNAPVDWLLICHIVAPVTYSSVSKATESMCHEFDFRNGKLFSKHDCNFNFNFNFILPKVNTDYMRQAQVLNIDKLRLIINLRKFNEKRKIT